MVMYHSSIDTGHVSLPFLVSTTLFPSLYWPVLLCRILILTSVLENCKSEHLIWAISLKWKNPEKARRQIVTVCMSNNDADSWANIFCSNCGDAGSFSPFASLLCDVHSLALFSLLGETLVIATLLVHAPTPVHSLHHFCF